MNAFFIFTNCSKKAGISINFISNWHWEGNQLVVVMSNDFRYCISQETEQKRFIELMEGLRASV